MRRACLRAVVLLAATVLGALPATAQAQPGPPSPPRITPDTSGCPYRSAPPQAVDLSEVPAPPATAPAPLPLPDQAVGGERMGECDTVLPDGAPPLPPGITATSWVVADLDSGDVLAAKDPHARHRPASTIKLLTALVAAERLDVDKVVEATRADADQEGSSAGVQAGGRYTVIQLLAGLLLVSGNDAAHTLARQLGGVPATLHAMNAKARELGATDTRAASVSGLDAPGMSSSAYDLALVTREVLDHPGFAELLRIQHLQLPGFGGRPPAVLSNDNKLLANYPGALGGKTGFTNDARHTYLGAAERDGRRLVAVLLRGEQRPVRMWQQAARLLDYGFALPAGDSVGELVDGPPRPHDEPAAPAPRPASGGSTEAAGSAPVAPRTDQPDNTLVLVWILIGAGGLAGLATLVSWQRDG